MENSSGGAEHGRNERCSLFVRIEGDVEYGKADHDDGHRDEQGVEERGIRFAVKPHGEREHANAQRQASACFKN